MNLFEMCINVIAKPEVIELYKNQLTVIPVKLKTVLFKILCKRGFIKHYILKELVHSNVTEVDLSECEVTDDILSCLFICKYIQRLDLSLRQRQTRCITTEILCSLLMNLLHLKILVIPYCKEINDEVIEIICNNCLDLNELHIPYSSITDVSLNYIGQKLHQLFIINILGTEITDVGVYQLLNGVLAKSLTEINIDKCPNITSYSVAIVAEKCNNIKIFCCGSGSNTEELALAINCISPKVKQVFWTI